MFSKIMKTKDALKYPLVKDYDFFPEMGSRGGSGILLIPSGDSFISREYGFGELRLIPYLQKFFSNKESVSLGKLEHELDEEREISLSSRPIGDGEWFLEKVLKRLEKHELININKKGEIVFREPLEISQGKNYEKARVFSMTPRGPYFGLGFA